MSIVLNIKNLNADCFESGLERVLAEIKETLDQKV